MSIHKQGNAWRVRWRLADGTMKSKTFDRKSDAVRFERDTLQSLDRGTYVDPKAGRVSVAAYAERWVDGQPWRDSSRARILHVLNSQVLPRFGSYRLDAVRRSDVQNWVGQMVRDGLKPSTVESYYRVLVALYRSAITDEVVVRSPCREIGLPSRERTSRSLVPILSEEVQRVAEAVPAHYRSMVWAQATLGLRTGEVTGLTVDRVNWLRRTVTIDRQLITPTTGAPVFGPPKTEASARTLEMSPWLAEQLAEHLRVFGEGEERLIFHTTTGAPVRRSHWASEFKKAATRVGVTARPHDLRHYAASLLINRGVSVKAVQTFCGHATAEETMDTYGHLWPDDRDRIAAIFDAEFRPADVPSMFPQVMRGD